MLSIIIPIYNSERTLKKTLDSILDQQFEESQLEVLLINDGSTDQSEIICKDYTSKYPDIFRYFFKKNGGVSETRNYGLRLSKGTWIYFIDADDYLLPRSLKSIVNKYISDDIDLIQFSYYASQNEKLIKIAREQKNTNTCDLLHQGQLNNNVWNTLIRKEIITNNKIFFNNMIIGEDVLFNFEIYLRKCRIKIVNESALVYVRNPASCTQNRSKSHLLACLQDYVTMFKIFHEYSQQIPGVKKIAETHFPHYIIRLIPAKFSIKEFKQHTQEIAPYIEQFTINIWVRLFKILKRFPFSYPLCASVYKIMYKLKILKHRCSTLFNSKSFT